MSLAPENARISFFFFFENISGPYILSILCEISNETTMLTHANIFQWKSLSEKKASRNSIHFSCEVTTVYLIADTPFLVKTETPRITFGNAGFWGTTALEA